MILQPAGLLLLPAFSKSILLSPAFTATHQFDVGVWIRRNTERVQQSAFNGFDALEGGLVS